MPRPWSVCNHRQRDEIEQALLKGEALNALSKRLGLPRANLWRHKAHIRTALAKMPEAAQLANGAVLTAHLKSLVEDVAL